MGFEYTFPRVPLVFRPKVKERKYDESEFRAENVNYESAKEHSQQIGVQFQEEEKLGFMFPLSELEARRRFGDRMRIASLGAIPKDDERVRVIFDATHFVQINNRITIQDRLEFPGPEASAAVMEETLESGYRLMVAVGCGHCASPQEVQAQRGGRRPSRVPSGGSGARLVSTALERLVWHVPPIILPGWRPCWGDW